MAEKYKSNSMKIYLFTALILCFCYSCSDNRKDNPKDPKERLLTLSNCFKRLFKSNFEEL
jgi:hypothetical protein